MKKLFVLPLLLLAGCAQRETETVIVVEPTPTSVTTIEISPVITPSPRPKSNVVVVQPKVAPPNVAPPKTVVKTETINKPAPARPQPTPTARPKPTAKPKPTLKPAAKVAVKPTVKPTPKLTTKPVAKPTTKPNTAPVVAKVNATPTLIVRAQVIQTSKVPEPNTVAYSDALVFTKYRVLSVEKGDYKPKEILIAQWGMKAKKLTPAARLQVGDTANLKLVELDKLPQLERIMRNDDTGDYDLTPYFALEN